MADYDPSKPRTINIHGSEDGDVVTRMLPPERIPPEMVGGSAALSPEEMDDFRTRMNAGFSERNRADARTVDRNAHINRVAQHLASFDSYGEGPLEFLNSGGNDSSGEYAYPPGFDASSYSSDELAADYIHSDRGLGEGAGPLGARQRFSEQSWSNPMGHEIHFHPLMEDAWGEQGPSTPENWNSYENVIGYALPEDGAEDLDHAYPGGAYNPQYTFSAFDETGNLLQQSDDPGELEDTVWDLAHESASKTAGATFDADTRLEKMMRQRGINNINLPRAGRGNVINVDADDIGRDYLRSPGLSGRY